MYTLGVLDVLILYLCTHSLIPRFVRRYCTCTVCTYMHIHEQARVQVQYMAVLLITDWRSYTVLLIYQIQLNMIMNQSTLINDGDGEPGSFRKRTDTVIIHSSALESSYCTP